MPISWTYYAFWLLATSGLALMFAHPWVIGVVVVAVIARPWIPDPVLWARHASRVRSLKTTIALNPANATARAQLAEIWLDKRRPKRAIPLIEQALERDPKSAELLYLLGLARLRAGKAESALEPLADALRHDDKVRYGSAYLAIGEALASVGRADDAIEAFQRYLKINTSSIEGYCKLLRVQRKHAPERADKTRAEALDTYRVLPGYQRRKQLLWWLAVRFG